MASFEQVLHTDRDGGGNGASYVNVKDGDNGTTFALQISNNGIKIVQPDSNYYVEICFGASAYQPYFKMRADDGTYVYVYPKKDGINYTLSCTPVIPA